MKLQWSSEVSITAGDGAVFNAFQMGTWAVRAEWPDGTYKLRLLERGLALQNRDTPHDEEFVKALRERFEEQAELVVIEGRRPAVRPQTTHAERKIG